VQQKFITQDHRLSSPSEAWPQWAPHGHIGVWVAAGIRLYSDFLAGGPGAGNRTTND